MVSSNPSEPIGSHVDGDEVERLFEQAPCGLISMALDGTIRVANDEFVSLSGRSRAELLAGVRFRDLLSGGGRVYYETHLAPMLLMQGFVRELALEIKRADGTRLPVLVSARLGRDCDGQPTHAQLVVLDATERRSYERELLVSNRRIERLQRITARFAAALDLEEVADEALDEIVDGVKADHGVLAILATREPRAMTALGVRGGPPEVASSWDAIAIEQVPALRDALASKLPLFIENSDGCDDGLPSLTVPGARCTRLAVLPLVVDDRAIGVLCLGSRTLATFEQGERTFLVSFAGACAQALQRARLQRQAAMSARRQEYLALMSRTLDEAVSFAGRAQIIVELLVPEFADFATIEVPERGRRPVAVAHVDPDLLDPLLELRTSVHVGAERPHSLDRGRETHEPQLLKDIPEALHTAYDLDDEQLTLLRRLAPRSYLGLPLLARSRLVGSLMLAMSTSSRRFGTDDVAFFVDLADRAALSLENARLHEQEHGLALRLQMSLLPATLPRDPRLRFNTFYRPNSESLEIGGDWYDAFFIDENRIGLAVGDVVGHNEQAALAMGQVSTALRAYALEGGGPNATIAHLSRFVATVPAALYTTVVYAEIDLVTRELRYTCAGHPPPILQEADRPATPLWKGRSSVLGLPSGAEPAEASLVLGDSATLLLYTDGLIERRSSSVHDGLGALVSRIQEFPPLASASSLDALITAVLDPAAPPADDVCAFSVSLVATDQLGAAGGA